MQKLNNIALNATKYYLKDKIICTRMYLVTKQQRT